METNGITPEKSLQIINEAIAKSRRDFENNSGYPMLIWGVVVLIFSIAVWILLKQTENTIWNFLWFGIPVVGWPLTSVLLKGKCNKGGKSFISRIIGQIWFSYGIFATVLSTVFAFIAPQFIGYITTVLLGFSAVMTGFMLKNTFITSGGFITGLGCTIALFFTGNDFVPLLFAAASVVNLIVPGIMMNRKAN